MRQTIAMVVVLLGAAGCGVSPARPTRPPIPVAADNKADITCQYQCATYDYQPGQCYEGWQCDAAGVCLTYVGTPAAPDSCPPACTPTSCQARNASCGTLDDGCGGKLSCGSCSGSDTCGGGGTANVCGHPAPPPPPPSGEAYDCRFVVTSRDGQGEVDKCVWATSQDDAQRIAENWEYHTDEGQKYCSENECAFDRCWQSAGPCPWPVISAP